MRKSYVMADMMEMYMCMCAMRMDFCVPVFDRFSISEIDCCTA